MIEPVEPGIRVCMKCQWLFVSPDISRIRRCADCKKKEDDYEPPRRRLVVSDEKYFFQEKDGFP